MTVGKPTPLDILRRYQQALLDKDADDLANLYAPDAVHELPFLFPGMPKQYEGREQVRSGYRAAWAHSTAQPREVRDVAVHMTADREVIVVEQMVGGVVDQEGPACFEFPGALVLRVRDGQIVHVRDYLDGLGVAHVLGRLGAATSGTRRSLGGARATDRLDQSQPRQAQRHRIRWVDAGARR